MGWSGYGLYDGDETQSCHINFIKWAIPSLNEEDIFDCFIGTRKTKLPKILTLSFKKGIVNILKKIRTPKNHFKWDEENAIEWQMLLSLFVDNNLKVPHIVLVNGMLASNYLLGEHASEFDEPTKRKATIKRFMKKVDENFCSIKARAEINRKLKVKAK